jgi:YHS domain-containing protein
MNGKNFGRAFVAVGLLVAIVVLLVGCKKKEEPTTSQGTTPTEAEKMVSDAQEVAAAAQEQAGEATLQTTCPVMGGPINKAIFVDYKGKKVYFCCKGCETEFLKDPEKYVAKLPQFQQ